MLYSNPLSPFCICLPITAVPTLYLSCPSVCHPFRQFYFDLFVLLPPQTIIKLIYLISSLVCCVHEYHSCLYLIYSLMTFFQFRMSSGSSKTIYFIWKELLTICQISTLYVTVLQIKGLYILVWCQRLFYCIIEICYKEFHYWVTHFSKTVCW